MDASTQPGISNNAGAVGLKNISKSVLANIPFVTHSIPKFASTSQIIGLNLVPLERAGQNKHGWYIDDFLAFKSLLHPAVTHHPENQTWLSAVNLAKAQDVHRNEYIHGYARPRSVAGAVDDKIIVYEDSKRLKGDFLNEITKRSKYAYESGSSLVLIVCGPVTAEQDIVFDLDNLKNQQLILTKDHIRRAVTPGTNIILVTAAVFSTGWLVNLCLTGDGPSGLDMNDENLLSLLSQHCSGSFASDLIKMFTTWNSPFLTAEERKAIQYPAHLMPLNSSDYQFASWYNFQIKIHQVLVHKFAAHGRAHEFVFEEGFYAWNRQSDGPPAKFWSKYWERLPEAHRNKQDDEGYAFLGGAFGNSKASQIFHLQCLAKIDRATAAEEFAQAGLKERNNLLETLQTFIQAVPEGTTVEEGHLQGIFNVLEYRSNQLILSDLLVGHAGLPRPQETDCRYFSPTTEDALGADDHSYRRALTKAWELTAGNQLFQPLSLNPEAPAVSLPRFWRPRGYLCAALALKSSRAQELTVELDTAMESLIASKITLLSTNLHKKQADMLTEVDEVAQAGMQWLKSIGLKKAPASSGEANVDVLVVSNSPLQATLNTPKTAVVANGYTTQPSNNAIRPTAGTLSGISPVAKPFQPSVDFASRLGSKSHAEPEIVTFGSKRLKLSTLADLTIKDSRASAKAEPESAGRAKSSTSAGKPLETTLSVPEAVLNRINPLGTPGAAGGDQPKVAEPSPASTAPAVPNDETSALVAMLTKMPKEQRETVMKLMQSLEKPAVPEPSDAAANAASSTPKRPRFSVSDSSSAAQKAGNTPPAAAWSPSKPQHGEESLAVSEERGRTPLRTLQPGRNRNAPSPARLAADYVVGHQENASATAAKNIGPLINTDVYYTNRSVNW